MLTTHFPLKYNEVLVAAASLELPDHFVLRLVRVGKPIISDLLWNLEATIRFGCHQPVDPLLHSRNRKLSQHRGWRVLLL